MAVRIRREGAWSCEERRLSLEAVPAYSIAASSAPTTSGAADGPMRPPTRKRRILLLFRQAGCASLAGSLVPFVSLYRFVSLVGRANGGDTDNDDTDHEGGECHVNTSVRRVSD